MMSKIRSLSLGLICLLASITWAETAPPEKPAAGNWQLVVIQTNEPLPDLDTLVRSKQVPSEKAGKAAKKACKKLTDRLAELAEITFHDNPPLDGRLILTLTISQGVDWNLPITDPNRAAAISSPGPQERDTRDMDRAEPVPLDDAPADLHGERDDYKIVSMKVELRDLDSVLIAAHECPKNDLGKLEVKELARMMVPDLIRQAARYREAGSSVGKSDTH